MQDAGGWISASALEYLRHKGTLSVSVEPVSGMHLRADVTYRFREGLYTDADGNIQAYGGVLLVNAGIEYRWRKVTFFIDGYNLTDRQYRDHGGVPQPGLTAQGGARLSL